MTIHYNQSIQGIDLLDRWQTEMKQFNIHARSHLVHHLRCINLDDIANRYYTTFYVLLNAELLVIMLHRLKYNQLQLPQTTGLAEASLLSQVSILTISCSLNTNMRNI